jgi:hypothetical protein
LKELSSSAQQYIQSVIDGLELGSRQIFLAMLCLLLQMQSDTTQSSCTNFTVTLTKGMYLAQGDKYHY